MSRAEHTMKNVALFVAQMVGVGLVIGGFPILLAWLLSEAVR